MLGSTSALGMLDVSSYGTSNFDDYDLNLPLQLRPKGLGLYTPDEVFHP